MDITPYVTNQDKNIFALRGLPPEVVAVLFAYYSRSPGDLRSKLREMIANDCVAAAQAPALAGASERAAAFHVKYVVGYGHRSVAEHAPIHIACEGVSIIASKAIEDCRLGSYTEKSTRYVVFDKDSFVTPAELHGAARDVYTSAVTKLLDTYATLMPRVTELVRQRMPEASDAAVRAQACDLLRGLLPAGTRTNLGLTGNARTIEHMVMKLSSSPLEEVRDIGYSMKTEAMALAPTLVKYADANDYRERQWGLAAGRLQMGMHMAAPTHHPRVRIGPWDFDALRDVVTAHLYEQGVLDVDAAWKAAGADGTNGMLNVLDGMMRGRGPHDPPPRALEHASISVEFCTDYGAYRDLQRHRMLSPAVQHLHCLYGTDPNDALALLGDRDIFERYHEALCEAGEAWRILSDTMSPGQLRAAQYVVPLAYKIRFLWTMNLRELFHVIELRSAKQGHASYRRVAQDLYHVVADALPWLAPYIRVDLNDYALARA